MRGSRALGRQSRGGGERGASDVRGQERLAELRGGRAGLAVSREGRWAGERCLHRQN